MTPKLINSANGDDFLDADDVSTICGHNDENASWNMLFRSQLIDDVRETQMEIITNGDLQLLE